MKQEYFRQLSSFVRAQLHAGEEFTAWLSGEHSDFVRFNHGRIRQAGHVEQAYLALRLIRGGQHGSSTLALCGQPATDQALIRRELDCLRESVAVSADDPYLLLERNAGTMSHSNPAALPPATALAEQIVGAADGLDLVGFLASGPIFNAYTSSFEQFYWHEGTSFNFDWSLYAHGDKAVKSAYAGTAWDCAGFSERLERGREQLELLRRPPRALPPGQYRAYLAPEALAEITDMLAWGGFSEQALRSRQSPLLRLAQGEATLHPLLELREATGAGLGPGFQAEGFRKPDSVSLVEGGHLVGSMISPRSAREYGVETNGADADETVQSLQMAPGALPENDALQALGTGLYIGNLWYLNFADRAAGRLTGMTRFASFWVENGEPVAPLAAMRFDDSLYRMLGSALEALTRERELLVDTGTYGGRQSSSRLLPGALLRELRLVL